MTRADLVDELSKAANLTKQDSEAVVDTVFEAITEALGRGDKVEIRGFGSFKIRQRRAPPRPEPKNRARGGGSRQKGPLLKGGEGAGGLGEAFHRGDRGG